MSRQPSGAQPTIAQLRAFVAVAESQHFGTAAKVLGVSQPTLSQALSTLEANIGLTLIERNPRRVLVTAAGERLLPLARGAVEAVDSFCTAALPGEPPTAELSLGIIPTIAPALVPPLMSALARETPGLDLQVHEDQTHVLLDLLAATTIEAAVLALPLDDSRIRCIDLYDEPFVLAVPREHPWAGARGIDAADLRDEELLFLSEGHCLGDQAIEVCRSAGLARAGEANPRSTSLSTLMSLVAAGRGMTFLPAGAVDSQVHSPAVAIARFAEPAPSRRVVLAFRRTSTRGDEFETIAAILRRAALDGLPGVTAL
ncbi:MAG: hydrogen peroxide-inducible genes activator [Candidatus Nanopelagicales bacterium]|nr:hydrogen peroxide-inducible genes activator [Candidatus Nanopelagicales bacterium]MCF8538325.1 hydrogen peroxide-inducible genes activator [Candidatus Nanopelagicales bacterium]MCF8542693.1 hydrogen peroxide-inducible genes activator [Candidatus Nanopelagicales bacterium]MCF8558325.1 hydrogen peroxide-inducible genes activator [Candidatus Nanopelagicales bacterium]